MGAEVKKVERKIDEETVVTQAGRPSISFDLVEDDDCTLIASKLTSLERRYFYVSFSFLFLAPVRGTRPLVVLRSVDEA